MAQDLAPLLEITIFPWLYETARIHNCSVNAYITPLTINCRGRIGDRPRAVVLARDMTVHFQEAIGALETVPHTL